MDNPMMTPNKILKLIHLAEDRSFQAAKAPRRPDFDEDEYARSYSIAPEIMENKPTYGESSSGILDLDRVEGFGDSETGSERNSKSAIFNPSEMTGRSTGTEDICRKTMSMDPYELTDLRNKLDQQTLQVKEVMRNSICTSFSFHSKRDLTADEESLIRREGILPFQQVHTQFGEITPTNASSLSVGAYFKSKCPEFGNMLAHSDSPNKSIMLPSITEVSTKSSDMNPAQSFNLDPSLDSVPVRQPRATNIIQEKGRNLNTVVEKICEKPQFNSTTKADNVGNMPMDKPEASSKQNQFLKHNQSKMEQSFSTFMKNSKLMNSTTKPTDMLLKNFHNVLRAYPDDTEDHENSSLSISKIADYLGKQSNVSVAGLLLNNQKKPNKKSPLVEVHLNNQAVNEDNLVSYLKDMKKTETASSTGTLNTVVSMDKLRINEMPQVIVTPNSPNRDDFKTEDVKRSTRSRSPSSKSQSTLSTVQENFNSFKSGDSPLYTSKGEAKTSHVPSPNTVYRELDKSVDWHEVLQQRRLKQEGLVKEQWADIITTPVAGFVGVSCAINIAVTTLTESWLTAKLHFDNLPNEGKDLTIELPRQPLLLSPGKTEQFTAYLTSNIEINTSLAFTILLKDASIDCELEQKGTVDVNIKMPVIQAMSCDGVNKISYPPIQENTTLIKSFVLVSDSPVDLQLELSIVEGESVFAIKSVQEIKRGDINKILMDRQGSTDDATSKSKNKMMNRQLCRLSSGNAIRVTIKFNAPKLADLNVEGNSLFTLSGALNVKLMGVNTLLRNIELTGVVGSVKLVISQSHKLHVTKEPSTINLSNKGTIAGIWIVKIQSHSDDYFPFKVAPSKFEIRPGCTKNINVSYNGPEDNVQEATLVFEETGSGNMTLLEIFGGADKKIFPIKTNHNIMSWVRSGRKELSLKNSMNRKVHIRCQILGDGFSVDLPGGESRGIYSLAFGPNECRPLPIIFSPTSNYPQSATLHLVYDKNSDFSRKVSLYGCGSGSSVKWSGLVTYGDTALVRALARAPLRLELYNRDNAPAFVCAHVRFNLQYEQASRGAVVSGARVVVCGRSRHSVCVSVPWAAVERRARAAQVSALATVTVLTGSEFTRRRILRIVRNESNGEIDTSLLPEHLRVLADQFEGEDLALDNYLRDFKETKSSLNELIGGLQELTAQIDLPQDFGEDTTIIISDDTVLEHHTLCD